METAAIREAISLFGDPVEYLWGDANIRKDNLPPLYLARFSSGTSAVVQKGDVLELRVDAVGVKALNLAGVLAMGWQVDPPAFIRALEQSQPAFEVASVKPAQPPMPGRRAVPLSGGPGTKSPTRLEGTASLKTLLTRAYGVRSYQITGPAWMETERYEIAAKIPPGATKEQVAAMLQILLKERFHLAVHRDTKELPTYVLSVGKNGPKFKESDAEATAEDEKAAAEAPLARPKVTMGADGFPQIPPDAKLPGSFVLTLSGGEFTRTKMFARHQTMDELADGIAGYVGRAVQNLTELAGRYDFTLAFESAPLIAGNPPEPPAAGALPVPSDHGPTIFAAVQEQLGLRLESKRGPVEMLMVDRVEKVPTEN